MAEVVPPVPYKTPVLDKSGFLSPAWSGWFKTLFIRIGQSNALSLTDLQSTVGTHTNQITALQSKDNDFGQGRQL